MTTTEFVIWLIAIAIALTIAATIELRHRQSRQDDADRGHDADAEPPRRRTH